MPELLKIEELPYALRVNGHSVQSLFLRRANDLADDFQVVITDPQVGRFALTEMCELEMSEEGSLWRPITLAQLTKALTESVQSLQIEDVPKASEAAERRLFSRLDDIELPNGGSSRLSEITGHVHCVRRVQNLLHEARIPHRIAGTVFVVPNALKARMCLMKAGLRRSTIAPAALVEPRSGCTIQLLEHRI